MWIWFCSRFFLNDYAFVLCIYIYIHAVLLDNQSATDCVALNLSLWHFMNQIWRLIGHNNIIIIVLVSEIAYAVCFNLQFPEPYTYLRYHPSSFSCSIFTAIIHDLQPISWNTPNNVACPRSLVPTIELIEYCFVTNTVTDHHHGRHAIILLFSSSTIFNYYSNPTLYS